MIDSLVGKVKKYVHYYRYVFIGTIIIGLITHMYIFTNKLVNWDDVHALFGKGSTLSVGRWGLELTRYIFPDFSMPWIYGITSIFLIAIACSICVCIFDIKNKLLQILLGAVIISFPSLTGTYSYMFTSSSYALALLLAIVSVYFSTKRRKRDNIYAISCLILSLSIYQAYIAVAASIFLIILIKDMLSNKLGVKELVYKSIKFILILAIALIVYFISLEIILLLSNSSLSSYAGQMGTGSVSIKDRLIGVVNAYYHFVITFTKGYKGLITGSLSRVVHVIAIIILVYVVIKIIIKKIRDIGKIVLLCLCIVLLPLAINCMFFIAPSTSVHSLVLYSFVAVYILMIVIVEIYMDYYIDLVKRFSIKDIATILLTIVIINNVYVANESYLKLQLTFDHTYSFYTSVITQVKETPGFDENSRVALIGVSREKINSMNKFSNINITGIASSWDLINYYSRESFIRNYIGFDIGFANGSEIETIKQTEAYNNMSTYPYYGSVAKINNFVVVKFE